MMKKFETYNLDTDVEESSGDSEGLKMTPEELQQKQELEIFRQESENLLKLHKSALESFSDSIIPELKFSNGVLINFKTMTVHLDTKFFFERKFNQRQMIWAAYHELAHFRDFISDPRRFMENFEHLKNKAEEYGQKIRDIVGTEKQEFSEEEIKKGYMDPADAKAYDSWHTFYNCLDDVYVNSLVARGVPFVYGKKGRNKEEASDLYQQVLFQKTDYSQLPKNRQFSYAILRKAMLPDEEITFSDEMRDILDREIEWAGKKIKVIDFIEKLQSQNRSGVKAGDRYFMIKKTLEPIFEELYNLDLEEWAEQKKEEEEKKQQEQDEQGEQQEKEDKEDQEGQSEDSESDKSEEGQEEQGEEGQGENSGDQENPEQEGEPADGQGGTPQNLDNEFNPESENSPKGKPELLPDFDPNNGDFTPEEIEDILDAIEKHKKDKQEKQEKDSGKEEKPNFKKAAQEREARQIKEWCAQNQVPIESYQRFEAIKAEIEPYLKILSELWENVIYGKGRDVINSSVHANIGEVDIDRVIKYYSDVLSGRADEVKVMRKKTKEILPANKPEIIKIRFVGDASGSVAMDSEKIAIMQKVYVLLTSSLRDFETKLNRTRSKTKSKLTVHTEGWVFGSSALKIKSFRKGRDYVSEQAEIIRQFSYIGRDLGSTYDNTAFAGIKKELTSGDFSGIKSGKIMDIVFEVTDGGSSNVEATRALVDELDSKGLIVKAFQVGETNVAEDESFNAVWNNGRQTKRGFKIGTDMQKVIPAIVASLREYLGDVKI